VQSNASYIVSIIVLYYTTIQEGSYENLESIQLEHQN
jgi:hypothetical protein